MTAPDLVSPSQCCLYLCHSLSPEHRFWKISFGMIDPNSSQRKTPLQTFLEARHITQRELSQRTGLTERTIHDWVKGVSIPRLDRAIVICKALNISLKELCFQLGLDIEGLPDDKGDD